MVDIEMAPIPAAADMIITLKKGLSFLLSWDGLANWMIKMLPLAAGERSKRVGAFKSNMRALSTQANAGKSITFKVKFATCNRLEEADNAT